MKLSFHLPPFKPVFTGVALLVFIIMVFRSAVVPFSHDETGTFFFYIQDGVFLPYHAHLDANNHVLNSFLGWICFKLFGSSIFVLRIPNLLGLLVLIAATYRFSRHLQQVYTKYVLMALLLLSYNWLCFFGVCRGYGMSMGLFVLALSYVLDYIIHERKLLYLLLAYFFLLLSISASLVLIVPALLITAVLCGFQLYTRSFFNWRNGLILLVHLAGILYWVKFSFFMRDTGALWLGKGSSYWEITFATLIDVLAGHKNIYYQGFFVGMLGWMLISTTDSFLERDKDNGNKNLFTAILFLFLFMALLTGFYLMKVFLKVNYPEDRAALFFYALFALSLPFVIDVLPLRTGSRIAMVLVAAIAIHFCVHLNFRKQCLVSYATIPERFYEQILADQEKSDHVLTVSGGSAKELYYAMMNYRHGSKLNAVDNEHLQLNSDYCIALNRENPYCAPYYDVVDREEDWGFTLFKRKEPIIKQLIKTGNDVQVNMDGKTEFVGFLSLNDTTLVNRNPVQVDFDITFEKAPAPLNAWLVLEIDSAGGAKSSYRRVVMNWLRYDWTNPAKTYHMALVSSKLPLHMQRLTFHLWNCQGQQAAFRMSNIKLYQLEAKGVDIEVDVRMDVKDHNE